MHNVCFFNSTVFWGGGEKFYFEYALGFKNKNYNVFVLCDKNSAISKKAKEHDLPQFNINKVRTLSFLNPFKLIKTLRFFKKEQIDTVIFSTSQDLKLGGLAAKLAGVKTIVHRRGLAVPIRNSLINRFLFQKILTHTLANSEETKRNILQNLSKYIDPKKVKVIYNGIDIKEATRKDITQLEVVKNKAKGIVLGNAGRLTPQKGQQHLIDIARRLKEKGLEFTLFIAGSGEMQSELEKLIQKNNLQNEVHLLGFIKDMNRFMKSLDIFLLTSAWEGFGYVLVEAMIQSKPVVAFNITSNPEILQKDKTGFLVDYPDLTAFAKKTQLLIEDEILRKEMGEAGYKRVIERFKIEDRISELEQFLKSN